MWISLFPFPFLSAFVLTTGLILIFLLVPIFRRKIWRFEERHRQKRAISRLGGMAMLISFIVIFLLEPHLVMTRELLGLLVGILFISLFGLLDDIAELGWKIQMFFQVALTVIIFIFGIRITSLTNPFGGVWIFPTESFIIPSFLILFIWLFLVMNAINWLDGLDGLCGGVSFITLLTIVFLSLKPEVNQPPIALLAAVGAAVTLSFLFFNIHPARILGGTVGSMFLGFLITVLAVIAGTKIATALLVLALPIADALWVIGGRLQAGVSIFLPDKRHLHYKLRELGWSEGHIAMVFFLVTAIIATIALSTQALGKFVAMVLVMAVVFSLLFFIERQTSGKKTRTSL